MIKETSINDSHAPEKTDDYYTKSPGSNNLQAGVKNAQNRILKLEELEQTLYQKFIPHFDELSLEDVALLDKVNAVVLKKNAGAIGELLHWKGFKARPEDMIREDEDIVAALSEEEITQVISILETTADIFGSEDEDFYGSEEYALSA